MSLRRLAFATLATAGLGSLTACTGSGMSAFGWKTDYKPSLGVEYKPGSADTATIHGQTPFASMPRAHVEATPGPMTQEPVTNTTTPTLARTPGTVVPLGSKQAISEPQAVPTDVMQVPTSVPATPLRPAPLQLPEPPLLAALRAHLAGTPDVAHDSLRTLDRPKFELLQPLLPAVVRLSQIDLNRPDPQEVANLASRFEDTAVALARRAPLGIDKAVFCRSVKTFGHYDPIPTVDGNPAPIKSGDITILYVEIANAPCERVEQNGHDGYITRLACSLELRDAEGRPIEMTDRSRKTVPALTETKHDFSRSPLRDYFMLFWFAAPARPGIYSVTFTVRDSLGGREVSRRIPFRVQ